MSSFPVVVALILCLLASTALAIDLNEVSEDAIGVVSMEGEIAKNAKIEEGKNTIPQEPDCDCGPHSYGCKIENGNKICNCKYSYRQENGICKAWCKEDRNCDNGGVCVNESCQCLPGTSGDFCKTVEECEGMKGPLLCGDPDMVSCMYDEKTQKPYCHCRIYDYLFYSKERRCIECMCGNSGSCSLVDGKKTCKCNEGYAVGKKPYWGEMRDTCVECNCGNNSNRCSFGDYDAKICDCKKGFSQEDYFGICKACDCGPYSTKCEYETRYRKICSCNPGYSPKNDVCTACDCGKNGECSFEKEVKQCKCSPEYALRDGICTACQCYAGNETVPCTFTDKIQKCLCPEGYETAKFICKDINECLNSSNSCPSTTDCLNTMGSYECVCKEGYVLTRNGSDPKEDGCKACDCGKNGVCSFIKEVKQCECYSGYALRDGICTAKEEPSSAWKIVLIVLGVLVCICVIGAVTAFFIKRRSASKSPHGADTTLEYLR